MVGKAALKESHQLRSLLIQDHWAFEAAEMIGPSARDEWLEEHQSPDLDHPPLASDQSRQLVCDLFGSAPTAPAEFTEQEWGSLVNLGDGLISSIGNLSDAAHFYIAGWRRSRSPTTMTTHGMGISKWHVGASLYDKGMEIAIQRVNAQSHAPPLRFAQTPYPSVRDNPDQSIKDLWPDLAEARLILFTARGECLLGQLVETKLSFAEHKDVSVEGDTKIRYICDPRLEINSRTDSRRHPFLFAPTIPSLLRRILYWKRRYPGIPVFLCKRDVKSAFKLIPLSIRMMYRAGLRIADYIMAYLSLYFGWKGAPGNWGAISSLLMQYVASSEPKNTHPMARKLRSLSIRRRRMFCRAGNRHQALDVCGTLGDGFPQSMGFNALNRDKNALSGNTPHWP